MSRIVLTILVSIMTIGSLAMAAESEVSQAPGRTMAQQATRDAGSWTTTDHSKHAALNQNFTSGRQITEACLSCHSEAADQFHKTIHWTWQMAPEGREADYGKAALSLNNFCLSANRGKDKGCLSCHPGWGMRTDDGINCLNCHSRKKMNWDEAITDIQGFIAEGEPEIAEEIQAELKEGIQAIGLPQRQNCGGCHFIGGGGDGVKHGDLDTSLTRPAKTLDVHMGVDGQNFDCVRCHTTDQHRIAGRVYTRPAATDRKSLVEDDRTAKITCESCHTARPHKDGHKANDHTDRVACQTCHIPTMARVNPTKMSWDWSKSGKLKDGKPYKTKDEFGKDNYLTIKGQMRWAKNVQPEYFWYNGVIRSKTARDRIDPSGAVALSWPEGSPGDANSRIYPFKVHRGRQPYDQEHNTLLAPLLSGKDGYWKTLDWQQALRLGQEAVGLPFSGRFDFVDTTYVFPTTHMVAPKADAVACAECHARTGSRLANVAGIYMPGRDRWNWLDRMGWLVILASAIGAALHGLGRVVTMGRNGKNGGHLQ